MTAAASIPSDLAELARIVHETSRIVLDAGGASLGTSLKTSRRDMVTAYDKLVQKTLVEKLSVAFPGVGFQCEEDVDLPIEQHCANGTRFIIDPIDGTANFVHHTGTSAVSVALVDGDRQVMGVVCNPFADELFAASAGKGAWLNGAAMPRIGDAQLADALVCVGTSLYFPNLYQRTLDLLARRGREFNDIRRTGSAACDCCYVADGRFGLFFELTLAPWDYAAGTLVARECGAHVSNVEGGPLVFDRRSSVLVGAPSAVEQFLAGEAGQQPIEQPDA